MKSKSVALLFALATSILGLTVGLLAADKAADKAAPKTATPLKKPTLKIDASPIGEVKGLVTSYADVLEAIRPAVVSVTSSKMVRQQVPEFLRQFGAQGREQKQSGLGSGVIISTDGFIITNNHVVEEADELKVFLNDDREFIAKVIGTDPKTDVAVIKIEAENLPAATLADSSKLRVGDVVFAIGNPLGVGQTVTMGIISATGRKVGILDEVGGYEDFIQTDAAINQGNSGGALIDARGRLVGINSAIISTSQGNIGIGFAIPINLASSIMHSLIDTGTVARGYMGVGTDPNPLTPDLAESFGLPKDTKGVVVTDLNPADGPAAKAGLKREDIITAIDGKAVASRDDLRMIVAQTAPGTKVTVKYYRDGKPQSAEITLGKLPDENAPTGELVSGVSVSPLTDDLRKELRIDDRVEGVVITEIATNSPYRETFPQGAVIEQLNRAPVTDLASAKRALRDGRNIALIFYRGVYRYVMFNTR
ncbi:Do family serine endopeptidase [Opitutus sp. GAS368]|uniref:Do family serine endopeptidase n=1 Tax=Opitutus sp. GAS368 TaxID=1882749 RepID=UPI000879D62C|nr:Do family serine endopeptidase [Opitutus sp. GAS368]SDS31310.1 serine protease Do/serine protease DegQ [Opitutus sp. GAS368]